MPPRIWDFFVNPCLLFAEKLHFLYVFFDFLLRNSKKSSTFAPDLKNKILFAIL